MINIAKDKLKELEDGQFYKGAFGAATLCSTTPVVRNLRDGVTEQPLDWFLMNAMDKFFTVDMPIGYQTAAASACITILLGAATAYNVIKTNKIKRDFVP